MEILTTGQVAKILGVAPTAITSLFYRQKLSEDICPVVSGRRLIPEDYLGQVACALHRAGKLIREEAANE